MNGPDSERYRIRSGSVVWRMIDGQVAALELDGSDYLSLNRSGSVLWSLMAVGATRRQLVDELLARFEVTPEQAGSDVDAFIRTCRDRDLLHE